MSHLLPLPFFYREPTASVRWRQRPNSNGRMYRRWLFVAGVYCLILSRWATAKLQSQSTNDCPDRSQCDFLDLPGIWEFGDADEKPTYQTLDPCCQLQSIVNEVLSSPEEPVSAQATHSGILFLGDSVDRFMLDVVCSNEMLLRSAASPHDIDSYWACQRGRFSFHVQAMAGVHPTGPYHLGVNGVPKDRLIHVRMNLELTLLANSPTMVIPMCACMP